MPGLRPRNRWPGTYVSLAEAREKGAMMLFGEKYPDPVRLVTMGDFSRELCGGTHVRNTKEVGAFAIVSEESVSMGTRRVVALSGDKAEEHATQTGQTLRQAAELFGVAPSEVPQATRALTRCIRDLRKQITSGTPPAKEPDTSPVAQSATELSTFEAVRAALRETAHLLNVTPFDVPHRIASLLTEVAQLRERVAELNAAGVLSADALIERGEMMGAVRVVVCETPGANTSLMRQLIDQVRKKSDNAAVLLATVQGSDKVTLVAGLSRALVDQGASAGQWVKQTAAIVGGGGGGRPDMAQAGGKSPEKLPAALAEARRLIAEMLRGEEA